MAIRPWHLAIAVALLALASTLYLARREPGRDVELAAAFASDVCRSTSNPDASRRNLNARRRRSSPLRRRRIRIAR